MDSPARVGIDKTIVPAHVEPAATPLVPVAGKAHETLGAQLRDIMIESATQHVEPLISAAAAVAAAYPVQEAGLAARAARVLLPGGGAAAAGGDDAVPAGGRAAAPEGGGAVPTSARDLADEMLRMVSPFPMALLGIHGPVDGTRHVTVRAIQEAVRRLGERHPAAMAAATSPRAGGPTALLQSLAPAQIAPLGSVCEIRPSFTAAHGIGDGFDIVARERFPVVLGRLSAGPYPLDFDAAPPSQGGVRFVAGFPVGKPQDYGGYRLDPGFAAEAADLSLTFPDIDAAARTAGGGKPAAPVPSGGGAGSRPISAAQAAIFARLYLACRADHAMMTAVSGLLGVTKAIYGLVASACEVFSAFDAPDDESDLFFAEHGQYLRLAQHPDFAFEVAAGADHDIAVRIRAVYPVAGYRDDPDAPWRVARGAGESHVAFATAFSIRRAADNAVSGREADAQRETAQWLDRLFATDADAPRDLPNAEAHGDRPERILAVRGATTMSVTIENRWRFDPVSGHGLP